MVTKFRFGESAISRRLVQNYARFSGKAEFRTTDRVFRGAHDQTAIANTKPAKKL
jgi:hypothetical protein